MRVLVCGGRAYSNRDLVYSILDDLLRRAKAAHHELILIHGCSSGADKLADAWARSRGVAMLRFPAKWREGRRAGPIRNTEMLKRGRPRLVVAFPGGVGTADMVRKAGAARVEVRMVR